ncbi:MAG: methyltransferase domain-containing protein [Chloroflexi bacterium]|nr:methyltransferase domain-containing protein [Chloroflexota bacterium]
MNHQDHVNLMRRGIPQPGGIWADFGSGSGAFTLALRELAGAQVEIYSIDKDQKRLAQQAATFQQKFPRSNIHFLPADFTQSLVLPPLDGIVMANVLHYYRDKEGLLRQIRPYLKKAGRLIVVEYNVDTGNPWVPYPITFERFQQVASAAGFATPELLATVPSSFLHQFYAAVAMKQP